MAVIVIAWVVSIGILTIGTVMMCAKVIMHKLDRILRELLDD